MTLSNAEIKRIKSLKDKKFRDMLGLFVVEGEKLVREAQESSFSVEAVYRIEDIGYEAMERISLLSNPSPVLAVVKKPEIHSSPKLEKGGLYMALDDIKDPGNMGTILRLADWFGVDAILCSETSVELFNPKVVQSTMGAIFRVKTHYCKLQTVLSSSDAEIFGTFLGGEDIYSAGLDSNKARIVVIGNEADGISPAIEKLCSRKLTIPSFASGRGPESLNAATAAAITLSEFRRR